MLILRLGDKKSSEVGCVFQLHKLQKFFAPIALQGSRGAGPADSPAAEAAGDVASSSLMCLKNAAKVSTDSRMLSDVEAKVAGCTAAGADVPVDEDDEDEDDEDDDDEAVLPDVVASAVLSFVIADAVALSSSSSRVCLLVRLLIRVLDRRTAPSSAAAVLVVPVAVPFPLVSKVPLKDRVGCAMLETVKGVLGMDMGRSCASCSSGNDPAGEDEGGEDERCFC